MAECQQIQKELWNYKSQFATTTIIIAARILKLVDRSGMRNGFYRVLKLLVHKMLVNCINKGWGKNIYSGETWQKSSSPSDQN